MPSSFAIDRKLKKNDARQIILARRNFFFFLPSSYPSLRSRNYLDTNPASSIAQQGFDHVQ